MDLMNEVPRLKDKYVVIDEATGCWNWNVTRTHDGYGQISGLYTHRLFYSFYVSEIPIGYQVDHKCKNTSCVNPEHLEAVTPKQNHNRSSKTKLQDHEVELLKIDYATGKFTQKELAIKYGLKRQGSVSNIITGARR